MVPVRVGRYLIYGLVDPVDRGLRYIGKTHKRREWRLDEHIKHAVENDQRPVYHWIRSLLLNNEQPEIFVLKKYLLILIGDKLRKKQFYFGNKITPLNFHIAILRKQRKVEKL